MLWQRVINDDMAKSEGRAKHLKEMRTTKVVERNQSNKNMAGSPVWQRYGRDLRKGQIGRK